MNNAQIVFPVKDLNKSCEIFCSTLGFQILYIYEKNNRKRIVLVKGPNLCSICLEQISEYDVAQPQNPYMELLVGSSNTFQKLRRNLSDQDVNELVSNEILSIFDHNGVRIQMVNNSVQRKFQNL